MRSKEERTLLENWLDEREASMLYAQMAEQEKSPKKRKIYKKLSKIEDEHARVWGEELKKRGITPRFKPRLRARILSLFGRILGHDSMLNALESGEGDAVSGYTSQVDVFKDKSIHEKLKKIIPEEKTHSRILDEIRGKPPGPMTGERWHQGGDYIRDVIFGMNDGLLSTFSLIMGIAGAAVSNALVLLAGLAGAVAGAISMAAGAYVSTKAEKETLEKNLNMERQELELMPEAEEDELALMYELKGVSKKEARKIARQIMSNKDLALETMAKEELGFAPEDTGSPGKAGLSSGVSFTIGASLPILPFALISGAYALKFAAVLSLSGFFVIGAGRTIVTGKNPWKSGLEMFLIGTAAAIFTYYIGSFIGGGLV